MQTINPFFASRRGVRRILSMDTTRPVYARLPRAPINASPVPHLTSLYHFHRAGEYGDRGYPGNCGGNLIKDLLRYFTPKTVFDPMTGSGTCRDVCRELGIPCTVRRHPPGFRRLRPEQFLRRVGHVSAAELRLHLAAPALLAAKALRRRSPRPIADADAGSVPGALRPVARPLRPMS